MRDRIRQMCRDGRSVSRALICAVLVLVHSPAVSAADDPLEYRVKAAFLFNFARFVTWPPSRFAADDSPVELCVVGAGGFRQVLEETVAGKTAAGRPLQVRGIQQPRELLGCHVAYVLADTPQESERLLAQLAGQGVLTVYERANTLATGVVRFYLDDRHVRFEINAAAAEREKLQVSSKLLAVARVVYL
jgi:hypothetical protein